MHSGNIRGAGSPAREQNGTRGISTSVAWGVEDRNVEAIFNACEKILRWGGVWLNNGSYLVKRKTALLDELLHLSAVLAGERPPSNGDLRAGLAAENARPWPTIADHE